MTLPDLKSTLQPSYGNIAGIRKLRDAVPQDSSSKHKHRSKEDKLRSTDTLLNFLQVTFIFGLPALDGQSHFTRLHLLPRCFLRHGTYFLTRFTFGKDLFGAHSFTLCIFGGNGVPKDNGGRGQLGQCFMFQQFSDKNRKLIQTRNLTRSYVQTTGEEVSPVGIIIFIAV